MKANNKRWESWERQIVVEKIQENPGNFAEAFDSASVELGRSPAAIANQFHSKIKPELKKQKIAITAQGSSKQMLVNSKQNPRRMSNKLEIVCSFVDELTDAEKKVVLQRVFKYL